MLFYHFGVVTIQKDLHSMDCLHQIQLTTTVSLVMRHMMQPNQKALTTDALDPVAAADDYKAAEKALHDNAHYNPLYFRNTKALQNPSIKGLVRNSTGLQVDFTYAYKDK